jgi:hypothetical protein
MLINQQPATSNQQPATSKLKQLKFTNLFISFFISLIFITVHSQCINVPSTDTNWGSWQRSSYTDGWTITNNNFSFTSTQRTIVTSAGHVVFGVGTTDYDTDPNFGTEGGTHLGIAPPSGPGISNIIRVGRKLNLNDNTAIPNGNASFVTFSFTPTASNSKFRIFYIGMGESSFNNGPTPYPIAATNFNSTTHGYGNSYEEPRFGVICKYDYTAPFSNVSPNPRTNIGMNEFGISSPTGFNGTTPTGFSLPSISNLVGPQTYDYGANDLFAGMQAGNPLVNPLNNGSSPSDFQPIVGHTTFRKMSNWKYYDLDFSEFVGYNSDPLNPTTVTITLFSHSSKASASKRPAYAYYAFQCLGGNVPATTPINYHIADQSFGCKPSTEILSLNPINTPLPPATWISYLANENEDLKWLSTPDAQGLNGNWDAGQPAAVVYPNHFAALQFQLKNSAGIFQPYTRIYSVPGWDRININVLPNEITGIYNNSISTSDPNNGRNFYRFKAIYTTMTAPAYETEFNVFVDFQSQPPPCTDTLFNGTTIINEKVGLYCSGNFNHTIDIDSSCLLTNTNINNITYQWQWYDENYGTFNDIPVAVGTALGINLTSQSLIITAPLINSIQAPTHTCAIWFSRKTTFAYDYHTIPSVPCDRGIISINSESYKVHLLGKQPISATVSHNMDVCYGETVGTGTNVLPITLNFPINTCQIPSSLFTTATYTQTV